MFPFFLFNPLNFRAVTTGTSLSPAYLVWEDVNFTSAAQAGFLTSLESRWSMQLINTHWRHYFCIAVAVSGVEEAGGRGNLGMRAQWQVQRAQRSLDGRSL